MFQNYHRNSMPSKIHMLFLFTRCFKEKVSLISENRDNHFVEPCQPSSLILHHTTQQTPSYLLLAALSTILPSPPQIGAFSRPQPGPTARSPGQVPQQPPGSINKANTKGTREQCKQKVCGNNRITEKLTVLKRKLN